MTPTGQQPALQEEVSSMSTLRSARSEEQRSSYRPSFNQTTRLKVHCGCGARLTSLQDGEAHASTTGHSLTILGEIRTNR